jgi:DNA-binding LytR/AlgR family response regulator
VNPNEESRRAAGAGPLTVLAVDDEPPALADLAFLLRRHPAIDRVLTASSAAEAAQVLDGAEVDGIFLDIRMPGMSGVAFAEDLARRGLALPIVFVTAYDEHAVAAFDLHAAHYLLKPIRAERLDVAIRRMAAQVGSRVVPPPPVAAPPAATDDETIPIELAGITRFISRTDVRYVEAQGDYARLHTADGGHLVRVPMATLEERWADAGFIRIHRSYLVALAHVVEVRFAPGRCSVVLGDEELAVSRRHTRQLRDVHVRRSRPGARGSGPE